MKKLFILGLLSFSLVAQARNIDFAGYRKCFFGTLNGQKICYFWIEKNASMFLRTFLFGEKANQHIQYYSKVCCRENEKSLYKIFCARDPLYRPISCYNEVLKLRRFGNAAKTRTMQFYKERDDICKSFKLFLDEINGNFYEPHLTHQYLALKSLGLDLEDIDFMFLFEELDHDTRLFAQKFNIDALDKPVNVSPSYKKSILVKYIDTHPEIQAKIRKIWAKDFVFYEKAKKRRKEILSRI